VGPSTEWNALLSLCKEQPFCVDWALASYPLLLSVLHLHKPHNQHWLKQLAWHRASLGRTDIWRLLLHKQSKRYWNKRTC